MPKSVCKLPDGFKLLAAFQTLKLVLNCMITYLSHICVQLLPIDMLATNQPIPAPLVVTAVNTILTGGRHYLSGEQTPTQHCNIAYVALIVTAGVGRYANCYVHVDGLIICTALSFGPTHAQWRF